MGEPMHVTPAALREALRQVDFPADKDAVLASASAVGADDEVLRALRSVPPEVAYANADEVVASVRHPEAGAGPTAQERHQRHRDAEQGRLAERLR